MLRRGDHRRHGSAPPPVERVAELMSGFSRTWALCGGWAIDGWLGRRPRFHADVDVSVFEEDLEELRHHLDGWSLVAHDEDDPESASPWKGRPLRLPAHIHAHDGRQFNLEIIASARSAGDWILHRQPRIKLPLRNGILNSPWRLPAASPVVLLFYKATAYYELEGMARPQDKLDFFALASKLSADELRWVGDAVAAVYPGHEWLKKLSWAAD